MNKMYSPIQVGVGTYIGGPFAAIYFLKRNFDTLGKVELSKKTVMVGIFTSILLLVLVPFIPESLPSNLIPILYLVPVVLTVKKHQLTKKEIIESDEYTFHSSWKVFGISLLWLFSFLVAAVPFMIFLDGLDVISLA